MMRPLSNTELGVLDMAAPVQFLAAEPFDSKLLVDTRAITFSNVTAKRLLFGGLWRRISW
jgi:hypothetical protein